MSACVRLCVQRRGVGSKICPFWGISSFLPLVVTNLPFLSSVIGITVFGANSLVAMATFSTYDNYLLLVTIIIMDPPLFTESALNTHCIASSSSSKVVLFVMLMTLMMSLAGIINQGETTSSENSHILFCSLILSIPVMMMVFHCVVVVVDTFGDPRCYGHSSSVRHHHHAIGCLVST